MKKLLLPMLVVLTASAIYSYQWPSNKEFLKSLFSTIEREEAQDGIRFSNSGQAVYPLTEGEIIFYQDSFQFGNLDYTGDEGNLLVLNHKGDFKSFYRNFIPSDGFDYSSMVLQSEMIGVSGKERDDFVFSVYDDKKDEYINPQQILPLLEDNIEPVINGVFLENNSKLVKVVWNKNLPQGLSRIYIEAWDVIKIDKKYKKFIPFGIYVFIDGFEKFHVTFSSIKEVDGELYFSGTENVPVNLFYSRESLLFGGEVFLTRGRSLIEVVVKDNNGNESSKSYSILVGQ